SGFGPLPASTVATPTLLSSGQLGFFRSAAPARSAASAIFPGGQYGTPFSFAVAPFGNLKSTPFSSCWPSGRVVCAGNGVKIRALLLWGWASRPGAKGRSAHDFAQGPPPGAWVRAKLPDGLAGGLPDHGTIDEAIAFGPQTGGLVSTPLALSKLSLKEV